MARKPPTPQDAATARCIVLDGLARDAQVFELLGELGAWHPRNDTVPGEVLLCLAADTLDWCRGQPHQPAAARRSAEAVPARITVPRPTEQQAPVRGPDAAALHGGTQPDLLDEVAWWQTDDFWEYALYAAIAYIRAAASQAGVPVRQACQNLGHPAP